jgi:hypothetical protein
MATQRLEMPASQSIPSMASIPSIFRRGRKDSPLELKKQLCGAFGLFFAGLGLAGFG